MGLIEYCRCFQKLKVKMDIICEHRGVQRRETGTIKASNGNLRNEMRNSLEVGRALREVSEVWVLFLGCTRLSEPIQLLLRCMHFTVCNLYARKRKKVREGRLTRLTKLLFSSVDSLVCLSQWFIFHVSGYLEVLSLDIFLKPFPVIFLFCEGKCKKSVFHDSLYHNTLNPSLLLPDCLYGNEIFALNWVYGW